VIGCPHRPTRKVVAMLRLLRRVLPSALVIAVLVGASPAFAATVNVTVVDGAFQPNLSKANQGDTLFWTFAVANTAAHTSTDNSGMGLWDSGSKSPGETFSFVFSWAGTYPYVCTFHGEMVGTIRVPTKAVPASGTLTTVFKITWASAPPPAGYNFDVQIKRPGSPSFVDWQVNQTINRSNFTPDAGTGVYQFRSRLQNGVGAASGYSQAKGITVN
jgi:plastocyanin